MDSIFSAKEPSLGYLYQVRYGLMLIVSANEPDAKLLIEKMDDISIETPDSLDLYQTKLHIKSVANLTDASTDLWKTIRVWSEGIKSGQLNPDNCLFNLITTAKASENTIPFRLKHQNSQSGNTDTLLEELIQVTQTSQSKTNKEAYEAFKELNIEQQKKLINNISIIDASIDINQAKKSIIDKLIYSVIPARVEALYVRLEGWFIGEVILQLQNQRAEITGKDVRDKILELADSLRLDNLPDDFPDSIAENEEQLSTFRNLLFVKQLEIVGIKSKSKIVNNAISDFYRAASQKSKWIRHGLINASDEMAYDKKLIEDWQKKFACFEDCDDLGEDELKSIGKNFYKDQYVLKTPNIHIKDRFKEPYMITGSCQILSNDKKIGWHPNYKKII